MNWDFSYATEEEVFPELLSNGFGVPAADWWVVLGRAIQDHISGVRPQPGRQGHRGVLGQQRRRALEDLREPRSRMDGGRDRPLRRHRGGGVPGRDRRGPDGALQGAAAWRNMATFGQLDETRHSQLQTYVPYQALSKEPRFDWAHKAYHTNEWGIIAARHLFDDMFTANDAVSMAIQLTFTFETGFTNVQFLGMAADAMKVGEVDFASLISSIQTDEARHAQQGEPTLKILVAAGKKDVAQAPFDKMFWRAWKLFALLTGPAMDYYTPLEHRTHSFKEFMDEFINTQFVDQLR